MQGPRRSFLHVNRCLYRGFSSASAGNLSVFCPGKIWLCRFPSTCPPVFFVGNTLQNLPAERKNTQHKETEKAYSTKPSLIKCRRPGEDGNAITGGLSIQVAALMKHNAVRDGSWNGMIRGGFSANIREQRSSAHQAPAAGCANILWAVGTG